MPADGDIKKPIFTRPLKAFGGSPPPSPQWFKDAIAAPSEEGAVEVAGAVIRYSAWGDRGKPGILFIHGGRAHRNWWRPFVPFFAADMRVAAFDISGMGDSDWRDAYSISVQADEAFAVIDAAGLNLAGRPIVVGHSFGGYVTLEAVEKGGDTLGGAVIVDSPLGVPDPHEGYVIQSPKRAVEPKRQGPRLYASLEEPVSRFRFLPDQPGNNLYLLDFIAREGLKRVSGPEGDGWTWKFDPYKPGDFHIHFERELLRAARCPLAFVYGEKSAFATAAAIGHLREQARGRSPFVIIPNAYHHLMMDQPMAFVSAMRTLLACWPVRFGS